MVGQSTSIKKYPSETPHDSGTADEPTTLKRKRSVTEQSINSTIQLEQRQPHNKYAESFVDSAYQSMTPDDGASADEMQGLNDTPSKKRTKRSAVSTAGVQLPGRDNATRYGSNGTPAQDEIQDTVVVDATASRASGRKRKQTWKAADAVEEPQGTPPSKRRATPNSRKKGDVLSELTTSKATLGSVDDPAADTPTKVPKSSARKKKARIEKDISGTEVENAQSLAAKALQVSQAILSDQDVTPTPTPQRRSRQSKAQLTNIASLGEIPSSDLSQTPTKREKKIKAVKGSGDSVPSPHTPSKRKPKSVVQFQTVKPVSWQQFQEPGVLDDQQCPDSEESRQALTAVLSQTDCADSLHQLKTNILQHLTGKRHMPLQGLDEEHRKVYSLVQQTVAAGESNSMLIIGPRGSGKTAMVESVVSALRKEHPDDFHTIRLNGFIHTDDRLALREIWRQLGREMEIQDDDILGRSNYADTLASLLAVLSHPTEQPESAAPGDQVAKSVIFVIDEFDLFTTHARQTLLYNLFDIAQSRKAPIAVLGLTTRVDVAESLEKRVKSRFSHRHVFLPRPKSFFAFQQIILSGLTAGEEGATNNEEEPNIDPLLAISKETSHVASSSKILHAAWCRYITSLFAPSSMVTSMLRHIYSVSRSVPMALTAFLQPIAAFTSSATIPSEASLGACPSLPSDSKLSLLPALTEVELALLIAAARLDIILDMDTANFNMAFDEYQTQTNKLRAQTSASGAFAIGGTGGAGARIWSRDAALTAWERLEMLELIMPLTAGYGPGSGITSGAGSGSTTAGGLATVGRAGRLMRCDVSLEEIQWSGLPMSAQMAKWCKEI